jgi:GrpB-like predicted nucleotidyltransferase (UPF0157 family)
MLWMSSYDRNWPRRYQEQRPELEDLAGSWIQGIEHIGSTAVRGMTAKPIIDILVGVAEENIQDDSLAASFGAAGFRLADIHATPVRRIFIRSQNGWQTNVHLVAHDGEIWRRLVLFRDWLRARPLVAEEYGKLKKRLVADCDGDQEEYGRGKRLFIDDAERAAVAQKQREGITQDELPQLIDMAVGYDPGWAPPDYTDGTDGPDWGWIDDGGGHWEFSTPDGTWSYEPDYPNDGVYTYTDDDGHTHIGGVDRSNDGSG